MLGEADAFHGGVDVERLKRISIVLVAAMTGVAVSVCGVIGFVGIVVPHLLRLVIGPAHRLLLPASVLLGAILMVGADTLARTIVAPAEMPIGILTAGGRRAVLPRHPAAAAWAVHTMTPVIAARSLTKRAGQATLVDAIDVSVSAGEMVAIIGPNGAGKSTLLRLLSGDIRPNTGEVQLKGRSIRSFTPRELAAHRAVLSQHINVTFPFTVEEIVLMGAGDRGGREGSYTGGIGPARGRAGGLPPRQLPTLSGGEQQRAHFARVLVQLACGEASMALAYCCWTNRPRASICATRSTSSKPHGGVPLMAPLCRRSCTILTSRSALPTGWWCCAVAG